MARRRRYGPVGSHYNSKKYYAMHKANISQGLRDYHFRRKAREAVENGTATAEQIEFVDAENRAGTIAFFVVLGIVIVLFSIAGYMA